MQSSFLLKGMIIGFLIAAPVGPVAIYCIRQTVQYGRLSGFFSGLGAAVADTLYGIIAAFSLTAISDLLLAGQFWLRVVGGIFLIGIGWKTFFTKPLEKTRLLRHTTFFRDFLTTFILTMTNPMTILSYVAVFAGIGVVALGTDYLDASWLVLGVFLGSTLWWLILSEGVTLFRKKIDQKAMMWINRIAGIIIASFGILAWASLFF